MTLVARLVAVIQVISADIAALKARPAGVPLVINGTYKVSGNTQVLFNRPPKIAGMLLIDGGLFVEA